MEHSIGDRLREGLGRFFSIGGGTVVLVSAFLVANAVRAVSFALKTEPAVIRTVEELEETHDNDFVELHARLDGARGLQMEAKGITYTLLPARDMGDRVIVYQRGAWVQGEETDAARVFRGQLVGPDWIGRSEWNVDAHRIKLLDQFSRKGVKIPETALVLWTGKEPEWRVSELIVGGLGAVVLLIFSVRLRRAAALLMGRSLSRAEPVDAAEINLSPAGKHSLTHDGRTVIPRSAARDDPAADAFEDRLLEWLQTRLGVAPISHAGTNTFFWKFELSGHEVEVAVIGQKKNTSTPPGPGIDWIIRVEEEEPLEFIRALERCFVSANRPKRKMPDDGKIKIRVQFKSTELLPGSDLAEG